MFPKVASPLLRINTLTMAEGVLPFVLILLEVYYEN